VLIVVLPMVFALLWMQLWHRRDVFGASLSRRGAFLLAFLVFETLLLLITELSSVGHHFTRWTVATLWFLVVCGLLALSRHEVARRGRELMTGRTLTRLGAWLARNVRTEAAAWLLIPVFYLGIEIYLSLVYLPSNGDSLDYHLARVEHWIQDQSVGPFAAHFTAQVDYPPLEEFNLAHFHLLFGGDRLDGFVQLFAAVVCVVAVSEITRVLGGTRLVQVGAAVICTTIPSLVLSATSTENNLFAASLCVCLIYVLVAEYPSRRWWVLALFAGLAGALAASTKGTAVLLIGPTAVALLLWRVATTMDDTPRAKVGRALRIVGVVAVVGVVLAGPFLYQNQRIFHSLDGPDAQAVLATNLTWRAAGADIVRSTASNFMVGNGTGGAETDASKFLLGKFHRVYDAFDVPLNDWDYFVGDDTPAYYDTFEARNFTVWDRSEDEGADPFDVILMGAAIVITVVFWVRGDRRMRVFVIMAATLTVGYLVLSGVSRWQIFGVRLYLPLFVAWCPVIAAALARCSAWVLRIAMVVLALACLPQLLDNSERPVLRNSHGPNPLAPYFLDSTDRSYVINTAVDVQMMSRLLAQSSCHELGIGNFVVIEYPVWVGLHDHDWNGQIEDVGVDNPTSRYEDRGFRPCAVVTAPTSTLVGTVPDRVQIGFGGHLELSVVPEDLQHARVQVPGFRSAVPSVRLYPGAGWKYSLTDDAPAPSLTGIGSVFVYSPVAQTVTLRVSGAGSPQAKVVATSSGGSVDGGVSDANGEVTVGLRPGVTQVALRVPSGAAVLTEVAVEAGTGP
jgi:hypothetical protein